MKIFHTIKAFFAPPARLLNSEKHRLLWWKALLHGLLSLSGGMLMAAAFPPLNLTLCAFFALSVLFLNVRNSSPLKAAFSGWLWGIGYSLCSFFWLREIHPAIPWVMMLVLGAYYIPVGWMAAVAYRYILLTPEVRQSGFTAQSTCRDFKLLRQLFWVMIMASTVTLAEYLRSSVLPWNYIGVVFYRNAVIMQLVRLCGIYGLTMLTVMINAALALAILTVARKDPEKNVMRYHRPWPLLIGLFLLALSMAYGIASLRERRMEYASYDHSVRMTLVQGYLSQRRMGSEATALEALQTYCKLTRTQTGVPTDLVVWPETAVNYPLRGGHQICALYRQEVRNLSREFSAPLLLGTLEFDLTQNPPGSLNSAVLTDTRDVLRHGYLASYSKVHRVPFGEYIPMRKYLPQWFINIIDMHRDLTPGKSFAPIVLNDHVSLGVNICFEDVFTYISREEVNRGANLLLVITNDAWYPTSSEPEQHLANSIARAIENNLPMVRCGNDSATCLITPGGEIIWSLAENLNFEDGKPFRRGAGAATITIKVPSQEQIKPTFYSRYGNYLVGIAAGFVAMALLTALKARLDFIAKTR